MIHRFFKKICKFGLEIGLFWFMVVTVIIAGFCLNLTFNLFGLEGNIPLKIVKMLFVTCLFTIVMYKLPDIVRDIKKMKANSEIYLDDCI